MRAKTKESIVTEGRLKWAVVTQERRGETDEWNKGDGGVLLGWSR